MLSALCTLVALSHLLLVHLSHLSLFRRILHLLYSLSCWDLENVPVPLLPPFTITGLLISILSGLLHFVERQCSGGDGRPRVELLHGG